jgi:hypothetical protein
MDTRWIAHTGQFALQLICAFLRLESASLQVQIAYSDG